MMHAPQSTISVKMCIMKMAVATTADSVSPMKHSMAKRKSSARVPHLTGNADHVDCGGRGRGSEEGGRGRGSCGGCACHDAR